MVHCIALHLLCDSIKKQYILRLPLANHLLQRVFQSPGSGRLPRPSLIQGHTAEPPDRQHCCQHLKRMMIVTKMVTNHHCSDDYQDVFNDDGDDNDNNHNDEHESDGDVNSKP